MAVSSVWKSFRLYHERNQYLKAAILKGRRARYEEFWALKGVDFEVPTGSTFGVIGSNGSGKSTLLKCLAGILVPEKGRSRSTAGSRHCSSSAPGSTRSSAAGRTCSSTAPSSACRRRRSTARFDDIVEFAGLEEFIDTPVKNYSSGMFVRLGFAVAAHVEPEVLLIDEVLSVGDESFQRKCAEKIEQFRQDGRTIVFVSHGLDQVQQLCEDVAWIDKGELRDVGPAADVITSYQGESHHARAGRRRAGRPLGQRRGADRPRRAARRRWASRRRC